MKRVTVVLFNGFRVKTTADKIAGNYLEIGNRSFLIAETL